MRRIAMIVGMMALMTVLVAPLALAVDKQCTRRPCEGTNNRDTLYERAGRGVPDIIYGLRGEDRIRAGIFGADRDVLYGGRGDDRLNAQDGDGRDVLRGGRGEDVCYVDEGDRPVGCDVVALVIE